MRKHRSIGFAVSLALGALPACNALTGVDQLEVSSGGDGSGAGGSGKSSSSGGAMQPTTSLIPVTGVTINEVSINQGVKRLLMSGGQPVTTGTPVVVGRDGLVRVFVAAGSSFTGGNVTMRLYVGEGAVPIEVTQAINGASTDAQLASSFNFKVPGAAITANAKYSVVVGKISPVPMAPPLTWSGTLPAESVGAELKVTIVPIKYQGRLPDTSQGMLDSYQKAFLGMYPVPKVTITVRAPWASSVSVDASGNGWSQLLMALADTREADGAASDVYYFGAFNPTAAFDSFCGGGCVAGLGLLSDNPTDTYSHAAIGLGFADSEPTATACHEIGHNHGRRHAPCMTPDPDPSWPKDSGHANGDTGSWGYDIVNAALHAPTSTDIMGYCDNRWIADYTFNAILDRVKTVNNALVVIPEDQRDRVYERVLIDGRGHVEWAAPIRLHAPPMAGPKTIEVERDGVNEAITGQFIPFDHLEGGVLFWPASSSRAGAVRLDVSGKSVRLTR